MKKRLLIPFFCTGLSLSIATLYAEDMTYSVKDIAPGQSLVMRYQPNSNAEKVVSIPHNAERIIDTGKTLQSDGYQWRFVQWISHRGWVRENNLLANTSNTNTVNTNTANRPSTTNAAINLSPAPNIAPPAALIPASRPARPVVAATAAPTNTASTPTPTIRVQQPQIRYSPAAPTQAARAGMLFNSADLQLSEALATSILNGQYQQRGGAAVIALPTPPQRSIALATRQAAQAQQQQEAVRHAAVQLQQAAARQAASAQQQQLAARQAAAQQQQLAAQQARQAAQQLAARQAAQKAKQQQQLAAQQARQAAQQAQKQQQLAAQRARQLAAQQAQVKQQQQLALQRARQAAQQAKTQQQRLAAQRALQATQKAQAKQQQLAAQRARQAAEQAKKQQLAAQKAQQAAAQKSQASTNRSPAPRAAIDYDKIIAATASRLNRRRNLQANLHSVIPVSQISAESRAALQRMAARYSRNNAAAAAPARATRVSSPAPAAPQKPQVITGMPSLLECGSRSPNWKLSVNLASKFIGYKAPTDKASSNAKLSQVVMKNVKSPIILAGNKGSTPINATITPTQSCNNGLAKIAYPYSIKASLNGRNVSGCCRVIK